MARRDAAIHPGRFGRRLFVWFAMATGLPVLLLSLIAYVQVHRQLEEDGYHQLYRVAKTIGMYLYARLEEMDARLAGHDPLAGRHVAIPGLLDVIEVDDTLRPLLQQRVSEQGGLLLALPEGEGRPRVLLIPEPWRDRYGLRFAALLDPDTLQPPAELLPVEVSFCLGDGFGVTVLCNADMSPALIAEVQNRRERMSTGKLEWSEGDQSRLAAYWSIFFRGSFASRDWLVAVSRDEAEVFASMDEFHTLLPQVLAAALVLAMLLAMIQLRQRLRPLGRVVEATRRFAAGDFSTRVTDVGGDELAQLADAFNHMADQTDQQFRRLESLAELDRLILSSFEEEKIIAITLERIQDLVACREVVFIGPPREDGQVTLISSRDGDAVRHVPVGGTAGLGGWLGELDGPTSVPAVLRRDWPVAASADQPTLFPVCRLGRCFGVVLVDWRDAAQQAEFLGALSEFSDRLAVALSNAAWEGELFHQAHYDALTGLANRTLLTDRLDQALARADRNGTRCALLFLDLDGFKTINDTLGHQHGDALLVTIARRLKAAATCAESVVRFGGDEFVLLITDIPADADLVVDLTATAERLIEVVSQPVEVARRRVALGASAGIAVYPGDGADGSELLRNADAAMYHAKAAGRGHAEFYAEQMNRDALARLALLQDLTEAVREGQGLYLEYQPQLCARTGAITGVEALARWRHPIRGVVSPGQFIPLAEESGLIVALGEWVLRHGCATLSALRARGLDIPRLGINVAPSQFHTPGFVDTVAEVLADTGLPPEVLELEITEGTVMRDPELGRTVLEQLHAMGVRLSVDDFGTGYSSLSYLQWLPVHTLKIDRSFVIGLGDGGSSDGIAAAIVTLGRRLKLNIIAEGVDQPAQVAVLREMGCDEFQGFLFSRPLAVDALVSWCAERDPAEVLRAAGR